MSHNPIGTFALLDAFKKGLKPDPLMTVNEWSDTYRMLPSESSSEPGRYRTDRMPYLKPIAYELSPQARTPEVSVIKGTQLGFTELGNNLLFCYAHLYPCPILQILPTEAAVRTHAKSKLWPSIKKSPSLKETFKEVKTKDGSSTTTLVFNGGSAELGWSNSPATFASMSRRIVINDDVDRWPQEVEGGDPLVLSANRADAFPNKKIYNNSSPAKKERSKILKKYLASSQGVYTMLCPHCDGDVVFEKDGFKFEHDEEYQLVGDVTFCCEHCGSMIEESYKHEMMKEENGARYVHKYPERDHKGFRVPSYYSPFLTWNQIFKQYLDAYKQMKTENSSLSMAAWTNTRDANVWEENFEKVDVSIFDGRHEKYNAEVPDGVLFLTAGVDTQNDRLEVEIVGWGKYGESWSIDYKILEGDPKYPNVWSKLDAILEKNYVHESGIDMRIMATGIDSGGQRTQYVYDYCRPRFESNVFCFKGDKAVETPIVKNRASRQNKGNVLLFMIGVNSAKDIVRSHIQVEQPGAGFMHYPDKEIYDKEYFKQLTAEKQDNTGRWHKFRARNEALDVRVYSLAALKILESQYYPDGIDWDHVESELQYRIELEFNNHGNDNEESSDSNEITNWRDEY